MSIASKLEALRKRLSEQEEAWGPDSEVETDHETGEAGEGGAENVSDINDTLIDYMLSIAGSVYENFDVDEDEAIDFVYDVADQLGEDGTLPFIPEEDDLAGTATWLGTAKMMGFGELVFSLAENQLDALEEE